MFPPCAAGARPCHHGYPGVLQVRAAACNKTAGSDANVPGQRVASRRGPLPPGPGRPGGADAATTCAFSSSAQME